LIRDLIQEGGRKGAWYSDYTRNANTFHQLTGSQTCSALAGEREKADVSCVFHTKEAE
jgi:hypothetical protein